MTSIVAPYGPWEPARPAEAAAIFSALPCPWWIAGGYAIELAIGRPVREHGDIDVLVLRRDQLRIQQALVQPLVSSLPVAGAGDVHCW